MDRELLKTTLKKLRPLHLISGFLLYALGVGISDYLGRSVDAGIYILGQIWIACVQVGFYFLGDYLGRPLEPGLINRSPFQEESEEAGSLEKKDPYLFISVISLSLAAAATVFLELQNKMTLPAIFLMVAFSAGYLLRVLPTISFGSVNFQEFIHTFQTVAIIPALAFLFQTGEYHRLLGLATFPLFALHLGMLLIFHFPSYAADITRGRKTILTQMGWKNGVTIHNILVTVAFLVLGISPLLNFPARFIYPVVLALPFAGFQVWYLGRLAQGAPTRWKLLTLNAVVLFLLPAYLLTYSFWTQ